MGTKKQQARGLFITLEGVEGSGKSTQIRHLAEVTDSGRIPCAPNQRTRRDCDRRSDPPYPPHGVVPRTSHASGRSPADPRCQMSARHASHQAGTASVALWCSATGFPIPPLPIKDSGAALIFKWLRAANEVATDGLTPDLTLVLDLPVSVGLARRRADRGQQNRLDRETERFHRKVRRGFLALAAEEPGRITIVNANRPAQEVRDELTEIVIGWMARQRRLPRRRR